MPSIDSKLREKLRKGVNSMIETRRFNVNEITGSIILNYPISPQTVKNHIKTLMEAGLVDEEDNTNLFFATKENYKKVQEEKEEENSK